MKKSDFKNSLRFWLSATLKIFSFGSRIAGAAPTLLDPDEAFKVRLRQKDKRIIVAEFVAAKHYHFYKDKIAFLLKNSPDISIRSVRFPAGIVKLDPSFGRVELFKDKIEVEIFLERVVSSSRLALVVNYQGCEEEAGVCYPPMQKEFVLALS